MCKSLIITEKPSVARDIAAVFGNLEDHDGWFEGDDYIGEPDNLAANLCAAADPGEILAASDKR